MTTQEAKRIVAGEIAKRNLSFGKLTARTVDFSDLARDACVFVRVRDWPHTCMGGPAIEHVAFAEIKAVAKIHGFCLEV